MATVKKIAAYLLLVLAGLSLLAYVDHVVVDNIYKQLIQNYGMSWNDFQTAPGGRMWWHVAFDILDVGMFALLAIVARRIHIFIGGVVLYHTGLEDILYYWVQGLSLPHSWAWTNLRPTISYTRLITRTADVNLPGILIAASVGFALYLAILFLREWKR